MLKKLYATKINHKSVNPKTKKRFKQPQTFFVKICFHHTYSLAFEKRKAPSLSFGEQSLNLGEM
jgi:hypothetical protein